ncbi:oligosaccharide flippase family protein [Thermaerobacter litoralis]
MSLRAQVLQGGVYLAVRQGLGMALSLMTVLLVTRTIGPGPYGTYAAAVGVATFAYNLGQLGIGVYLIRRAEQPEIGDYHQAFTLLLCTSLFAALLAMPLAPLLARWTSIVDLAPVARVVFLALPLQLLALVPLAQLERDLAYRTVATVELLGQAGFIVVAVPLALLGVGVWAPVAGWWAQHGLIFALLYRFAGYRPRLLLDSVRVRAILGYSLSYSASIWIWQLRPLVNPLVVGRFAGAEAVGLVALAMRLVEMLSFVKSVTWRLSIAGLARLQADRARLLLALEEGMRLQVLAMGPVLFAFALVGPPILDRVFGPRWNGVMEVYPFVALGVLVNALFALHSSALYVYKENWAVAWFHLVHIVLLFLAATFFVPHLGVKGYAWAEIMALVSYTVIHSQLVRRIGRPAYGPAGLWTLAFGIGLFWPVAGPVAGLPIALLLLCPRTWHVIRDYRATLRGAAHG